MHVCTRNSEHMEVRGHLVGVTSLLPPCGSQGLNSGPIRLGNRETLYSLSQLASLSTSSQICEKWQGKRVEDEGGKGGRRLWERRGTSSNQPPMPTAPHLGGWVLSRGIPQQLGHDILHFHQSLVAARQLLLHREGQSLVAASCFPSPSTMSLSLPCHSSPTMGSQAPSGPVMPDSTLWATGHPFSLKASTEDKIHTPEVVPKA